MKYRALRRLKHRLERLHDVLHLGLNYHTDVFNYNWSIKPTTPEKHLLQTIKLIKNAIHRELKP